MMLVFIMNAIIFTISVSIRACGHRCGRKKKIVEEEDDDREYELDLDTFDKTQPVPRPSTTTIKELTGAQKLAGFARKTFAKNNADDNRGSLRTSIFDRDSTFTIGDGAEELADEDEEANEGLFDIEAASMELFSLLNIVRQRDELVFVHCGTDAYIYMRYQKFMITMLWCMSFVGMGLMLFQYSKRDKDNIDATFYAWANAGNVHMPECSDSGDELHTTGCMWPHFFASVFFSGCVLVYLKEFRKLMVKLTDPTYVQELESRVPEIERWQGMGEQDDHDNEIVMRESKGRTLMLDHIPRDLSKWDLEKEVDKILPGQLMVAHLPCRLGKSMMTKVPIASVATHFQSKGAGSGSAFLTFKSRAQARKFRSVFRKIQKMKENKQSINIAGEEVNLYFDIPQFLKSTIERVTDLDGIVKETEQILTLENTNLLRRFLFCCPRREAVGAVGALTLDDNADTSQAAYVSADELPDRATTSPSAASPERVVQFGLETEFEPEPERDADLLANPAGGVGRESVVADPWDSPRPAAASDYSHEPDLPPPDLGGDEIREHSVSPDGRSNSPDSLRDSLSPSPESRTPQANEADDRMVMKLPEHFKAKSWTVAWAPEASDIMWMNLHVGRRARRIRVIIFNLILLAIFLAIAVALQRYDYQTSLAGEMREVVNATGIGDHDEKHMFGHTLQFGKLAYGLSTYYAPVMVLTIQNFGIMPVVCMATAANQGYRLRSLQEKSVLVKNFTLLFFNLLILPSLALRDTAALTKNLQFMTASHDANEAYIWQMGRCDYNCRCYGASTLHVCNAAVDKDFPCERTWDDYGPFKAKFGEEPTQKLTDGCARHTTHKGNPDKDYPLSVLCHHNTVYCHKVTVACVGPCDFDDSAKVLGNLVLNLNASFMFCFVLSASLLGTAWQLLNLAFFIFCFVKAKCGKLSASRGKDKDVMFWDMAAGDNEGIKNTMKKEGWAFELGYYSAVGLTIFAIVLTYSVVFPAILLAGLLYFNCKHFVDKYNLLYVYPVDAKCGHVRSGGLLGATVHDIVLFTLCFFQLIMCAFFYLKNRNAMFYEFIMFMGTFAWFLVCLRQPPPATTEVKFGDENRQVVGGELILGCVNGMQPCLYDPM
jgi:hypothetical protein